MNRRVLTFTHVTRERTLRKRVARWRIATARAVRQRFPHLVPDEVADRTLSRLRASDVLTSDELQQIAPLLRRYEQEYAWASVVGRCASLLVSIYALLPLAVFVIWISPPLCDALLKSRYSMPGGALPSWAAHFWGLSFSTLLVLTVMVWQVLRDRAQRTPRALRYGAVILGVAAALTACRILAGVAAGTDYSGSQRTWEALCLSLMVLGVGSAFFINRKVVAWNLSPDRRRLLSDLPCAAAVHDLTSVILRVPCSELGWSNAATKRDLMRRLNRVARAVDPHMGIYFRCGHSEIDKWIAQQCGQMAAAIHGLARAAFAPARNSHDEYRRRIKDLFIVFVQGVWDAVPRVERENASSVTLVDKMGPTLTNVLVALVPLGLLVFYILLPIHRTTPKFSDPAILGVLMLSATALMSVLNPKLQADVGIAKQIGELLRIPAR